MAALAEGSTGSSVKKLQGNLNKVLASGPKLKVSGTFEAATKIAVQRFQKKAGLAGSGVADSGTMKALKTHIEGLEWSHGDPASDKVSISSAVSQLKKTVATVNEKVAKAEATCRSVADVLKTKGTSLATKANDGLTHYADQMKVLDDLVKQRKAFDVAKKSHDLARQKEILARAKELAEKSDDLSAKAYGKIEQAGTLRAECETAVEGLAKVDVSRG
ncbi:MAG: peptidoglycan-binding domain-containing protein [Pseudomonadota bacterium]